MRNTTYTQPNFYLLPHQQQVYTTYAMHLVYKEIGETPLACIQRIFTEPVQIAERIKPPHTYIGRLDPMAQGLLLIAHGEECKQAHRYFSLKKEYRYSFIVGIGTDSYDRLGRITACTDVPEDIETHVQNAVKKLQGNITLPYPPYSSKTIHGKPLFTYAKSGTLHHETIPKQDITIYAHTITDAGTVDTTSVAADTEQVIRTVQGDFRQPAIIKDWQQVPHKKLPHFSGTISGSGGMYVRAIVHAIGEQVGYKTVTTAITRTRIGQWSTDDLDAGKLFSSVM